MVQPVNFAVVGAPAGPAAAWLADGIRAEFRRKGYREVNPEDEAPRVVLNLIDAQRPRAYRRKAQATFVVSVAEGDGEPGDVLAAGYPLLVRALSNLLIYLVPDGRVSNGGRARTHFVTLEQGQYPIPYGGDDAAFFSQVVQRMEPLATSRLVITNRFVPDLSEKLWEGDEVTRALYRAGRRLDALGLLPAPFPIEKMLSERDLRHVKRLYGIGGLSYGNLSARRDAISFWMSASGVDKSNLAVIGRDILLVTGYDPEENSMVLSVPPGVEPRRVSVDAIEHWMIYTEHSEVGAIVHVHAWMDGIPSTHVNYPCGTYELAGAVAELVRQAPDPARAVIGLKNHGLTITGPSLEEIFDRIEGRLLLQVPMT